MKILIITRHAKSDWNQLHQNDFERELNTRGLRDAPEMGRRLVQKGISLQLILSSSAMRARQTASLIAKELHYAPENIRWADTLYHASATAIGQHINFIENNIDILMVVGHNPGITHFGNMQCGIITDNIPTCGMLAFESKAEKWEDWNKSEKSLLFFDFPKNNNPVH